MITLSINIITKASDNSIYEEVAINKYPIMIFDDADVADKDIIKSIIKENFDNNEDIKVLFKSEKVFNNSYFYVRYIDDNTYELLEDTIKASDVLELK